MKNTLAIILISTFSVLNAQESNSFLSKYSIDAEPIGFTSLSEYSVFNSKTTFDLIPESATLKAITLNEQAFAPINQAFIMGNDGVNGLNPYLGSATTRNFQLLNKEVRSTYIFDANGNLRSSQMSISLGKKN
ncbi:hypothetical protein [Ekhidna sp.]|uniref:hypothetical protein n=1 Tax=Ekhidna sp. TaxID=2608089 RepID=UPI003B5A6582